MAKYEESSTYDGCLINGLVLGGRLQSDECLNTTSTYHFAFLAFRSSSAISSQSSASARALSSVAASSALFFFSHILFLSRFSLRLSRSPLTAASVTMRRSSWPVLSAFPYLHASFQTWQFSMNPLAPQDAWFPVPCLHMRTSPTETRKQNVSGKTLQPKGHLWVGGCWQPYIIRVWPQFISSLCRRGTVPPANFA
jgi:hypothetical protein